MEQKATTSAFRSDDQGAGTQAPTPPVAAENEIASRRDSPERVRMRNRRRAIFQPMMSSLGTWFTRLLAATWRIQRLNHERFPPELPEGGRLVAMWHGRLLVGLHPHRNLGFEVLVSPSGDGELVHSVLRASGYGTLRGSSSKNAPRALREMLRELRQAKTVVITPDGPRGPFHSMNPGLAWLSRNTGYPIVPLGYAARWAIRLKSWDRFTIPLPFSRVAIAYGEPIQVARSGGDGELNRCTQQIHNDLNALERSAAQAISAQPDA